ncbi:MAG: type-F conjugative transfer system secretin TraK [Pseudomonadota bacterium]
MLRILITLFTVVFVISGPARADQFKTVADNGTIEGYASALDITRLSLVGDQIASVKKTDTDEFGDDFNIAHDTATGDIYVTLPAVYDQTHLNFFITTKKGFTYKAHLAIRDTPSTQLFVQNPGVGSEDAEAWELETPFRQTVIRLIQAMWTRSVVDGYEVKRSLDLTQEGDTLSYRVTARYDGAALVGRILKVENLTNEAILLSEDAFLVPGVIAASLAARSLGPRETAYVYIVARKGAA